MPKTSWPILGLILLFAVCFSLSVTKANAAASAADPLEGTYIQEESLNPDEVPDDVNLNIEESVGEEPIVEPEMPLPEGFTKPSDSSDLKDIPSSTMPDEKSTSVTAVMDKDGNVSVADGPAITPPAPVAQDESQDSIVEEKINETGFGDDMEPVTAEVMKRDSSEDLQGSPLREFDINRDLQASPLLQWEIKNDLQNSPLLKYQLKFSGKEAHTGVEKGKSFKDFDPEKTAPKFKQWKAPYNKSSKQKTGSIVEEKYEK